MRKESVTMQMTSEDELRDMGLNDVDVNDYINILRKASGSEGSSDMDSLNSERMEVWNF